MRVQRKLRVDKNQATLVKQLRDGGRTVITLQSVGNGCPDLLVGYKGVNYLLEVKDGSKPPSKRKLTPDQISFRRDWNGKMSVVTSIDGALRATCGD